MPPMPPSPPARRTRWSAVRRRRAGAVGSRRGRGWGAGRSRRALTGGRLARGEASRSAMLEKLRRRQGWAKRLVGDLIRLGRRAGGCNLENEGTRGDTRGKCPAGGEEDAILLVIIFHSNRNDQNYCRTVSEKKSNEFFGLTVFFTRKVFFIISLFKKTITDLYLLLLSSYCLHGRKRRGR